MDADIQIMVGTVQTDWFSCQVCDSVTRVFWHIVFAIHTISFMEQSVVFPFTLLPSSIVFGREERSFFWGRHLGAGVDGCKFHFSRWSQGCIEPPKLELVSPFSHSWQKFQRTLSCNHLNSSFLRCSILHLGLKSCVVVAVFVAYSK